MSRVLKSTSMAASTFKNLALSQRFKHLLSIMFEGHFINL